MIFDSKSSLQGLLRIGIIFNSQEIVKYLGFVEKVSDEGRQ